MNDDMHADLHATATSGFGGLPAEHKCHAKLEGSTAIVFNRYYDVRAAGCYTCSGFECWRIESGRRGFGVSSYLRPPLSILLSAEATKLWQLSQQKL